MRRSRFSLLPILVNNGVNIYNVRDFRPAHLFWFQMKQGEDDAKHRSRPKAASCKHTATLNCFVCSLIFWGLFQVLFWLGGNGTPPAILSPGACVCLAGISQKNRPPDLFFGKRHEELLIALRIQNADRLDLIRRGLFKEHSAVAVQHVRFGFQDPDLRGGNRAAFP